jgi:glutamate racemase
MKLGIFDSGIGGEAVAATLQVTFPQAEIITVNDKKNVPYGNKTPDEVTAFTNAAIQPLLHTSCDIIILACNTASAIAIESLRARYPEQKFIGIEPMVKTAATLTKSQVIAVCATPVTLASARYQNLVAKYGAHLTILEPYRSDWAYMIENNQTNHQAIEQIVHEACDRGADVIVLGCTHYHWIKDFIKKVVNGRAEVIEPSEAIGRRVTSLLGLSEHR